MPRTIALGALLAIHVAGCSVIGNPFGHTELTPSGARVRMRSNATDVSKCEFLGEVQGTDDIQIASDLREANAIRALKNAAAEKGGDTVLVISTSNQGSRQHGEAYRCGNVGP
jgi:hypothetical protein